MSVKRIVLIGVGIMFLLHTLFNFTYLADVDISEIPGTYVANHGQGEEILIINEDGTYKLSYQANKDAKMGNRLLNFSILSLG